MSVSRLIALTGLLLASAFAPVNGAVQAATAAPFMPGGMVVDGPDGYVDMCRHAAALCGEQPDAAPDGAPVVLINWSGKTAADQAPADPSGRAELSDRARMTMLNQINRYVNGHVSQHSDMSMYGVQEIWRRSGVGPGATGDCKDIAIEKRAELIDQGFPAHDLFYAIGFRPDIGLHAVLIAHTSTGDVVLDSRTPYITTWSDAPYTWVKRQSSEDPASWSLVGGPQPAPADIHVASLDGAAADRFASAQAH